MTAKFDWDNVQSEEWLGALSLPTLTWMQPFLPLLGLPTALLEDLESYKSIYIDVATEYETQIRAKDWVAIQYAGRGEVLRQAVVAILQQLSTQIGHDVAVELEQWVCFHFFCPEASSAMNEWGIVLRHAYLSPDSRLLPELHDLVRLDRRKEIWCALKQLAPPPAYEQTPYEKLDNCYECTLASNAIDQALTFKALQTIANHLNELECLEVVDWAKTQDLIMNPKYGHPERLCENKYLQTTLPQPPTQLALEFSDKQ
jgi:hypothetical protein